LLRFLFPQVTFSLACVCSAAPTNPFKSSFQGYDASVFDYVFDMTSSSSNPAAAYAMKATRDSDCPPKQVVNIDGFCSTPDVSQNVYVYGSPESFRNRGSTPKPDIPNPKIEYNVVVIRSDESEEDDGPIIIPPPEQKTVVLVLKKDKGNKRKIIEVEAKDENPEVYFVNYKDGENPELPGGIDLRTALEITGESQVAGVDQGENEINDRPYSWLSTGSQSSSPSDNLQASLPLVQHFDQVLSHQRPQDNPVQQEMQYTLPSPRQRYSQTSDQQQNAPSSQFAENFSVVQGTPSPYYFRNDKVKRDFGSTDFRASQQYPKEPKQLLKRESQAFVPSVKLTQKTGGKRTLDETTEADAANRQRGIKQSHYIAHYRLPSS
ncbi:UNVERIFIED_CONTAM: hypothetical protein GTU68_025256, partial [Idotea baltica]|nr:hypothetical protein [Idotea baltica]